MDVKLRKQSAGKWGPPVPVTARDFLVGGGPACHLRVQEEGVSPSHCRIITRNGRVMIGDLNSGTGTEVNGRLILEPIEVHDGDQFRVGPAFFQFEIESDGEPSGRPTRAVTAEPRRAGPGRLNGNHGAGAAALEDTLSKLQVSDRGEVSLVKVLDNVLITDQEIGDFSGELGRLIDAGHRRLALDFGNVKHMSSQVIAEVFQASRRCAQAGGKLKLCTVQPQVAAAFAITGMQRHLECFVDAKQALASEWPKGGPARPEPPAPVPAAAPASDRAPARRSAAFRPSETSAQPVTMVDFPIPAQFATSYDPRIDHPAPAVPPPPGASVEIPEIARPRSVRDLPECATASFEAESGLEPPATPAAPPPAPRAAALPRRVGLLVLEGKAKGQVIAVRERKFVIGRDATCQLRPHSQWISRIHTSIEQRPAGVFVRDLGSTNGTTVNDRRLVEDEEVEVADGDRLDLGPLKFQFAISFVAVAITNAPARPPVEPIALPEPEPEPEPAADDEIVLMPLEPSSARVESAPAAEEPCPRETVVSNPYADLQFSYAVQPGPEVRLVEAGAVPPWAAMLGQVPQQGWGMVGQLLQALMSAGGNGLAVPAAVVAPPSNVFPPAAALPSVAIAPPAPAARPVAAVPAPSAPLALATVPPAVPPAPRMIAPAPPVAAVPLAAGADGPFSGNDHEIEVLLKDLPERDDAVETTAIARPSRKVDADAAEEMLAIQEELTAFLENLPEGREESRRDEADDFEEVAAEGSEPEEQYEVVAPESRKLAPQAPPKQRKEDITLEFECPACGAEGVAPVSRLGSQFFCKVCAAKFTIEGTGAVLVGDHQKPAAAAAASREHLRPPKKATSDRINDRLEQALFYWQDIPQPVKVRGFMTVVALSLAPWLINILFFNDPLKNQSLRTVDALIHVNQDQLKAISTEKTKAETLQWMNMVSTVVKKRLDGGAKTRVQIAAQDPKGGSATVMVYFDSRQSSASGGLGLSSAAPVAVPDGEEEQIVPGDGEMKFLVLLWQKSPQGKWLLEGNKTLEYANRLAAASAPAPPARAGGRRGAPKSVPPPKAAPDIYGRDGGPQPPATELIARDQTSIRVHLFMENSFPDAPASFSAPPGLAPSPKTSC